MSDRIVLGGRPARRRRCRIISIPAASVLVAAVVMVGLALAVFAPGLRGPAVAVTVLDDAVVR